MMLSLSWSVTEIADWERLGVFMPHGQSRGTALVMMASLRQVSVAREAGAGSVAFDTVRRFPHSAQLSLVKVVAAAETCNGYHLLGRCQLDPRPDRMAPTSPRPVGGLFPDIIPCTVLR